MVSSLGEKDERSVVELIYKKTNNNDFSLRMTVSGRVTRFRHIFHPCTEIDYEETRSVLSGYAFKLTWA